MKNEQIVCSNGTGTAYCVELDIEVVLATIKTCDFDLTKEMLEKIQIAWDGCVSEEFACELKAANEDEFNRIFEPMSDKDFRLFFEEQLQKEDMNWYLYQSEVWMVDVHQMPFIAKFRHQEYWPQPFRDLEIGLHDLEVTEEVLRRLGDDKDNHMTRGLFCRDSMVRAIYNDCADAISNLQQHFERK